MSYELPNPKNNINETNNSFIYKINRQTKIIKLTESYYNIYNLLDEIQKGFNELNDNINISLAEKDHIIIEHKDGIKFSIENGSLNKNLGFINKNENNNYFISDVPHNFNEQKKIYMFIKIGSEYDNRPFAILDLTKRYNELCPIKKSYNEPIKYVDSLIIRFQKDENPKGQLYDFGNAPHRLKFNLVTE